MLSTSCRRMFPVLRNQAQPIATSIHAERIATRNLTTLQMDKAHDLSRTYSYGQKLHRTKTDNPNAEFFTESAPAKLVKTKSGIHKDNGKASWMRDSAPSMIAFWGCILGIPPAIGFLTNDRAPSYFGGPSQNAILVRQRDVKQEFGKGGGGWGTGPNGNEYSQKRAEWGFVDKQRTRHLAANQPKMYQETN